MEYIKLNLDEINKVKTLWEKLNRYHENNSINFKEKFKNFDFTSRIKHFTNKVDQGHYNIEIVRDKNLEVGYCLSSITKDGTGEIDSIFVIEQYRGNNIGETLIKNSLQFFKKHNAKKIILGVAAGNEDVFSFYSKFGFKPKVTILEKQ